MSGMESDNDGDVPGMGHAGSDGGAIVTEEEKHTPRESEGSQESKASDVPSEGGERRRTFGSMVSPTLNPIVNPDVTNDDREAESSSKLKIWFNVMALDN